MGDSTPQGRGKTMTDEQILVFIRKHPDRAVTAPEVAESMGVTSAGALQRLNKLESNGDVVKKKVGARAVVWWLPERYQSSDSVEAD